MTVKEYLSQIRILESQLQNVSAEIIKAREDLGRIRSAWPDGQPHGSGTKDPVGEEAAELADKLMELEHQHLETLSRLWSKRMEIVGTIGQVQDADCNRLLYLRYVEGRKWEEIAVELGYTYQWVCGALHGKALQIIREIINT